MPNALLSGWILHALNSHLIPAQPPRQRLEERRACHFPDIAFLVGSAGEDDCHGFAGFAEVVLDLTGEPAADDWRLEGAGHGEGEEG